MSLVTLNDAKLQCRLETDQTDEDAYLQILIDAAINKVQNDTNKILVEVGTTPLEGEIVISLALKMAVLLLIGHWFANREAVVTGAIAITVPLAYESLIYPYCEKLVG